MKTISFSVVEILPSLLDKSKAQTIRPAWKYFDRVMVPIGMTGKPARFKVGDTAEIYWKQRSKGKAYCKVCGCCVDKWITQIKILSVFRVLRVYCGKCKKDQPYFNKILGVVEITEIFKIEMKNESQYCLELYDEVKDKWSEKGDNYKRDLAKKDGFKSAEQMFKFVEMFYGLDFPKEFYVYRWEWL